MIEYHKIIEDEQRNGIIEKVTKSNSETELEVKGTRYSPHHAVVRKDRETTKVRVVYDGSAKNSKEILCTHSIFFFGQFCLRGKGAMRLTLYEVSTHETRPDHNTGNFVPCTLG